MRVVVIGGGLAGLRAARLLGDDGCDVEIIEASSRLGGRIESIHRDGFILDRGFALLNPAYPAARRALSLRDLDLHAFDRGACMVWPTRDGRVRRSVMAMPHQSPASVGNLFRYSQPSDVVGLARLAWRPSEGLTFSQAIDQVGLSQPMERMLRGFMAGVCADESLGCSAQFAASLLRFFLRGAPSLPAQGMQALVADLTAHLQATVHLNTQALSVERRDNAGQLVVTVREEAGKERRLGADRVVVAAGPRATGRLLGVHEPMMGTLRTWWFASDSRPTTSGMLHVDLDDRSPIAHAAVVSNVCPSYAPAGRHLVEVTAVGPVRNASESDGCAAAQRAGELFGCESSGWQLLDYHAVVDALPRVSGQEIHSVIPGVEVAGDSGHASIQGALESGEKAAARIVSSV